MADGMRTVVVRRNPRRHRIQQLVILLAVVAMAAGSYWAGRWHAQADLVTTRAALMLVEERLATLTAEQEIQRADLARLSVGAEVDRQSMEQLRDTIRRQQKTAAELQEEIGFYKGLMAPTESERGLGIRSWEVWSLPEPGHYHFKLTIQQLAVKHSVLQGHVVAEIVGYEQGEERVLSVHELSDQFEQRELKLRFKYFQHIEGDIRLPDGFEPQRVDIVASATRPRRVNVERHFGWVPQE